MKILNPLILIALLVLECHVAWAQDNETTLYKEGPIQLHPENPHYFKYQNRTMALITSAEHYGAVLNLDFDYKTYLRTLAEDGMNYTRIFTGSYFENPGDFGIEHNTLAPKKGKVITPWQVDYSNPERHIYDLSKFNTKYFERLSDFMVTADTYGIIVEITLFSSIYQDASWDINPQNPKNNKNLSDTLNRRDAQTINNKELWSYQEKFVRKIVTELNAFDNFFFEIQNEPWSDNTLSVLNIVNKEELVENDWQTKADFAQPHSMAWQEKIAKTINETEEALPKKHLIAQNYTNYKAPIPEVSEHIDIINFHYAWPEAIVWNYHYNKVIGFDESGFAGSSDQVYRRQAWRFMLSGGGLFNNLDYSFYVGSENGLGNYKSPGGGSKVLRKQLKILNDFLHGFALEELRPAPSVVFESAGLIPNVLSDNKGSFAIYLQSVGTDTSTLRLKTANGNYEVRQLNTHTSILSEATTVTTEDGILSIEVTIPEGELALKIKKLQ